MPANKESNDNLTEKKPETERVSFPGIDINATEESANSYACSVNPVTEVGVALSSENKRVAADSALKQISLTKQNKTKSK